MMLLFLILLIVWFAIKPKYAVYWIMESKESVPPSLPIERTLVPPKAYDDRFMEL